MVKVMNTPYKYIHVFDEIGIAEPIATTEMSEEYIVRTLFSFLSAYKGAIADDRHTHPALMKLLEGFVQRNVKVTREVPAEVYAKSDWIVVSLTDLSVGIW